MLGPFGHLMHTIGIFGVIWTGLAVAAYLALIGPRFRGLLLPALPLRPGGRVRRSLQISSYLARGFCAAYLAAAWAGGFAIYFGFVTGANAYTRTFSGGSLVNHVMIGAYDVMAFTVIPAGVSYVWVAYLFYERVRHWEQVRLQRRRDERAARTLTAIQDGAPAPYGAYSIWLRPFTSTGRCWVVARSSKAGKGTQSAQLAGYDITVTDLETLLAQVMEPVAPVIALGKSGEQVGAGRVDVPGDRWQEEFALLARSAHAIFLLPSLSDGTAWELGFLLREPALLDRTVFLVPPAFFGAVSEIASVGRDPGARALGGIRETKKKLYGDEGAKGTFETYRRLHAVNSEAISHMLAAEGPETRGEALRALEAILPPDDYAAVAEATTWGGGALLKLANDRAVRATALASLWVGRPGWRHFSDGPRFDQPLFRAGLLKMVQP